jgi:hypothetical protein
MQAKAVASNLKAGKERRRGHYLERSPFLSNSAGKDAHVDSIAEERALIAEGKQGEPIDGSWEGCCCTSRIVDSYEQRSESAAIQTRDSCRDPSRWMGDQLNLYSRMCCNCLSGDQYPPQITARHLRSPEVQSSGPELSLGLPQRQAIIPLGRTGNNSLAELPT